MYQHVFVAGTFEGLHKGHRALLARAFAVGVKVTIGVTSDQFVKKFKVKNHELRIRNYKSRKSVLEDWLQENHLTSRATIIPIDDPYDPAASMVGVDAIVVTKETRVKGQEINRKRKARGLTSLALIEVPLVSARDGNPISATRVRNGEIDRDGRLVMPDSLRSTLGKPLGKVLRGQAIAQSIRRNRDRVITTVGDVATKTLLDAGVTPYLSIVDGKVSRKPYPHTISQLRKRSSCEAKIISGPGYISREATEAIQDCFSHNASRITHNVLVIDGEEDLLVLPALVYTPWGTIIYYGQPGKGLVEVVVTQVAKREAIALLSRFL